MDIKHLPVIKNTAQHRFEVQLGAQVGVIQFVEYNGNYYLTHTEVPPEYGGQGIGDHLVKTALDMIRAEGKGIWSQPVCPFVQKYIQRHKAYQDLVV
jgi:hypothetical protein